MKFFPPLRTSAGSARSCIPRDQRAAFACIAQLSSLWLAPLLAAQPVILVAPTNSAVRAGTHASFTVQASGSGPITYQWRKADVNLPGATGATLALGPARPGLAGNYSVVVTSQDGSVTSAPSANLTILPRLTGSVAAWGANDSGQLVAPPAAQEDVIAIAAGQQHTLALKANGAIVAWGGNSFQQTTVPSAAGSGFSSIAAGKEHSIALSGDNAVFAWGNNNYGQITVPDAATNGVAAVAAGGLHTLALKTNGAVIGWGDNAFGQISIPLAAQQAVVAVAAGFHHSVALKLDGSVVAWGGNGNDQCIVPPEAQSGVIAIVAGSYHTLALKDDGSIVAWGSNLDGESTVPPAAQSGAATIAAGLYFSLAQKNDGSVVAWGNNDARLTAVPDALTGAFAIAGGGFHAAVVVVPTAPVIIAGPVDQTVNLGQDATFTVVATGFPQYFEWRRDEVVLPNASHATLSIPSVQTHDAGAYTVIVRNPAGSVTSRPPALLTVTSFAPEILVQPAALAVAAGQTAFFYVAAMHPPLTYQWSKDGVEIPGATGATCALGPARSDLAGVYTVIVRNPAGSVTSAPLAGLVIAAPKPGLIATWGDNSANQSVFPAAAQRDVVAIAAGGIHTVALKNDGSILTWGYFSSELGTTPAAARTGVVGIAAGNSRTIVLRNDRTIVAWEGSTAEESVVPSAAQREVVAVAAGGLHSLALKQDGSVVAWGINGSPQIAVPTAARSGVAAIAAGDAHSVALKLDGSVVAWGDNTHGQVSIPSAARQAVVAIAAGGAHTLALKRDGSIVAWGDASLGQGLPPAAAQSNLIALAAGEQFSLALRNDGSLVAWGDNAFGQTTLPRLDGVTMISAGSRHSAAVFAPAAPVIVRQPVSQTVKVNDRVTLTVEATGQPSPQFQWRFNGTAIDGATNSVLQLDGVTRAQTGTYDVLVTNSEGFTLSAAVTLTIHFVVEFTATRMALAETSRVVTVAVQRIGAGPEVVTVNYAASDGTAVGGQDHLGTDGTLTFGPWDTEPVQFISIPILDDDFPEGAEFLRLTLTGLGGPAVFGANAQALITLFDNERSTHSPPRLNPVFGAGTRHAVAIKTDGTLWAWGDNDTGQLGTGLPLGQTGSMPVRVGSDQDWAVVVVGSKHTLALKTDGSLWAWGDNSNGQLGLGGSALAIVTEPVPVGADTDWVMLAAGLAHSLGIKRDGSLWAWGWNAYGQLGLDDESLLSANVPMRVGSSNDWARIAAGWSQSLAVKTDGSLWTWGNNSEGALGVDNSLFPFEFSPTPVAGSDLNWELVVTSGGAEGFGTAASESFGLNTDGRLLSWGANQFGQLGDGTIAGRSFPLEAGPESDWTAVAAGPYHAIALKADGSLWAWGRNQRGALGLGSGFETESARSSPSQIGSDHDWIAVAAGWDFSLALKQDGSLWAWGANMSGQLGLGPGASVSTNIPTRIDAGATASWAQPTIAPVDGDFRIVGQSIQPDRSHTLFFTYTNARAYYILLHGASFTNIAEPVAVTLPSRLAAATDPGSHPDLDTGFYRLLAVPRAQPLDLDEDGIDDYSELRYAGLLDPLDARDASLDADRDGYSNLAEYRAGTDPGRHTVRHAIASGLKHTVVLKQDGSLWAWGDNAYGQLGDGTYESREQPVRVSADTDWISVSAGRSAPDNPIPGDHTVALKKDGSIWAWGANGYGQLGFPPDLAPSISAPVRVSGGRSWVEVVAGSGYTAALRQDGSLWVWGHISCFVPCCGDTWTPTRLGAETDWITLAAGGYHFLALKIDRSLWRWGFELSGQCSSSFGRVGDDNDWIAIAAAGGRLGSEGHSLGLKANGTLWAWGLNNYGELGSQSRQPFAEPTRVGADSDWTAIAAGSGTSAARKSDGSLWIWGAFDCCDTGVPETWTPIRVGNDLDWGEIALGGFADAHSFSATALKTDGSLWSWPLDHSRIPIPSQVGAGADWAAIAAGHAHSLAMGYDGRIWAWGWNRSGQLGNGVFATSYPFGVDQPQPIDADHTWKFIAAGERHSVAVTDNDTLRSFGDNAAGQLGDGTLASRNSPNSIEPAMRWETTAAGSAHTVALRTDRTLWTWGANAFGQLGIGIFTTSFPFGIPTPRRVATNWTWKSATAGRAHTLALRDDSTLWAWGANDSGQLGIGVVTSDPPFGFSFPQPVLSNVTWKTVAAGFNHTLAIQADGTLWGWGNNTAGQLGVGGITPESPREFPSPQPVGTHANWKSIAAGQLHTVGLRSDGTLWTWGRNEDGQLGDTTFNDSRSPRWIEPNMTWTAVAAGSRHTLAIRADGTLWAWGANEFGQLGIVRRLVPRRLGADNDWGIGR